MAGEEGDDGVAVWGGRGGGLGEVGLAEALVLGAREEEVGFEGGDLGEEGVALLLLGGVVVERFEAAELGGGECWWGFGVNSLVKLAWLAGEAEHGGSFGGLVGRAGDDFERGGTLKSLREDFTPSWPPRGCVVNTRRRGTNYRVGMLWSGRKFGLRLRLGLGVRYRRLDGGVSRVWRPAQSATRKWIQNLIVIVGPWWRQRPWFWNA